jgi:hypothetical protein
MFKNKAIQMTVVDKKDAESGSDTITVKSVDYAKIAEIATESTVKIVKIAGAAFAANKVLTTVCEIAKIAAQAKLK